MRRYEGLLRPARYPAPWPSRWVVVTTEGCPIPCDRRQGIRHTGLSAWHAVILDMRRERSVHHEYYTGCYAHDLWDLMRNISRAPGLTWVISPRALYSWTLLGLWERILLNDIRVANSQPIRRRSPSSQGMGRPPGMLMVADPPSAAGLLVGAEGRRVTWICARNYGWSYPVEVESAYEIAQRLAVDVELASLALARHNLGGWRATIGSLAERAWRYRYMRECLYIDCDPTAQRLCRDAICGGRMSAREPGTRWRRAYHVDARGSYGHITHINPLPIALCRIGAGALPEIDRDPASALSVLARVRLRTGDGRYPVRQDDEVSFPEGPCRTVLCGPELCDALDRGLVEGVEEYAVYHLGHPLSEFQEACYAMRCDAEMTGRRNVACLAKALAVSIIGRMHAYEEIWEECVPDYNDPVCGTWYGPDGQGGMTLWRAVAGQVSRRLRAGMSATACPAVALWAWSYGRLWLLERIEAAGWWNVLYAHTDGLVVNEEGYHRLEDLGYIHDQAWGQLRYLAGPVEAEMLTPHCVRVGDELIEPGVPKDQRGREYVEEGYWFRRPFGGADEPWTEGIWEEQYRDYARQSSPSCTEE